MLLLFTDTLGDVNGVSRFVRQMAACAAERALPLHVITSTRFECPAGATIHNLAPSRAVRLPGYPNLEVVLPPRRRILDLADRLNPAAIHVSTPGPVGLLGRSIARRMRARGDAAGCRLVGTYHTDFPAYIAHLFEHARPGPLSLAAAEVMRWFYRPFDRVLLRSAGSVSAAAPLELGAGRQSVLPLGVDLATFSAAQRPADPASFWASYGARGAGPTALYVGRVSVEKNLALLAIAWPAIVDRCSAAGMAPKLVIVGDGPYRPALERIMTAGHRPNPGHSPPLFLGFRFGQELSRLYAAADVFLFPSETDTLGQVVLEAQASGLPVIASSRGGPAEIVRHDQTGFLVDTADTRTWTESTVALLLDPARRAAMSGAAVARVHRLSIGRTFEAFWSAHTDAAGSTLSS